MGWRREWGWRRAAEKGGAGEGKWGWRRAGLRRAGLRRGRLEAEERWAQSCKEARGGWDSFRTIEARRRAKWV